MKDQPLLLIDLSKAWSKEAREAAIAARRANKKSDVPAISNAHETTADKVGKDVHGRDPGPTGGSGSGKIPKTASQIEVGENTPGKTTVKAHVEIVGRMQPPKGADQQHVAAHERTPDYSSAMLEEKYGTERGKASYEGMIDRVQGGTFFTVHNQIVKEKKAMMAALGKTGSHENHHYQGLYRLYHEKLASQPAVSPGKQRWGDGPEFPIRQKDPSRVAKWRSNRERSRINRERGR